MQPHASPPDRNGVAPDAGSLRRIVDVAAGRAPADLRLRGAAVLDPFLGGARPAEVLIVERWIAAVIPPGEEGRPPPVSDVELDGGLLSPGLIDGHMHLESSLVTPARYAEAVLPRGVTAVVCDPHEVANVAGVPGVRWLLDRAAGLPFDVIATVPSCVPSTTLETPGAELGLDEIDELLGDDGVVGLAELMSFPAVVAGDPYTLAKAAAAERTGAVVEGHAPGMSGSDLQAYLASGVASDHETSRLDEGREKLRAGAFLWMREGSVARDAAALAPLLAEARGERLGFCSDDQLPHDLLRDGGVDHAVRTSIRAGADPHAALSAATWSAARHYRLPRRGAIAPGHLSDIVWWRGDPGELRAGRVWKEGREVARDGRATVSIAASVNAAADALLRDTVELPADLRRRLEEAVRIRPEASHEASVPAVGVRPASLLTDRRDVAMPSDDGRLVADPKRDLVLLVCAERHRRGGRVAAGLAHGTGLRRGALACSVGHDHHNLMSLGADLASIEAALRRVEAMGGGLVAVDGDEVQAELSLPLAGLLTDASLEEVVEALDRLDAASSSLGVTLPSPLMALSFLGLAVIPDLKLTDHGLVDVHAGAIVDVPWGPRPG